MPLPNRLALYVTGVVSLLAGLAPLIGNLDWESTAGIAAGLIPIGAVVSVWLNNWGKWERQNEGGLLEDEFDEELAEPHPPEVQQAAYEGHTPGGEREGAQLTDEQRIERERAAKKIDDELAQRGVIPPGPAGA